MTVVATTLTIVDGIIPAFSGMTVEGVPVGAVKMVILAEAGIQQFSGCAEPGPSGSIARRSATIPQGGFIHA